MKLFYYILWLFKGIKVFALVGKSGTGKSFRAKLIAEKYGIELIIDDGLLIRDNSIIAGKSAKKETAYLTAIKTAIFNEGGHREEVCHALQTQRFNRILILGTSEKMVKKITKRLKLPHISKMIHIEDIATEEEINNAIKSRHMEGKHIIPVPTIEIQRDYSHIIYDSVKVFVKKKLFNIGKGNEKYYEKTVVQPEFSQKKGKVTISETALTQMIIHCADEFDHTIKIKKVKVKSDIKGYKIKLYIQVPYRTQLSGKIHNFQQYVINNIERYAGVIINEVNLKVENLLSH